MLGSRCCFLEQKDGLSLTSTKEDPSKYQQILGAAIEVARNVRQDVVVDARWDGTHA